MQNKDLVTYMMQTLSSCKYFYRRNIEDCYEYAKHKGYTTDLTKEQVIEVVMKSFAVNAN